MLYQEQSRVIYFYSNSMNCRSGSLLVTFDIICQHTGQFMLTTVEEAIRKAVSVGTFGQFIVSEENFAYETLEGEIK